jgi:hypothetical protein
MLERSYCENWAETKGGLFFRSIPFLVSVLPNTLKIIDHMMQKFELRHL